MSAPDLARRVHDLVREPPKRKQFKEQTEAYIRWRIKNARESVPLEPFGGRGTETGEAAYFPFDRYFHFGPPLDYAIPDVMVMEKYAVLAAIHDKHYADDGPIMPPPDCRDHESRVWYILLGYVHDHLHRHAERVEDWYKDVLADIRDNGNLAPQPPADSTGTQVDEPDDAKDGHELKPPSADAVAAYRLFFLQGKTQTAIAEELTAEWDRPVSQGSVSRWIKQAEAWIRAGNVLPGIESTSAKPMTIDPALIDLGERQDSRTKRQRDKRSEA